ncbi:hypothetical protein rosmuc_01097 [Roseovarius mucosus DSM 17069]|uniref:Restriction endonuclease n=1 Tax=Roseovarius mucosus DSM 17069 TaxID=1288298 RepID=A0A0A0HNW0_9RHOB|nr:hypothetical protein rosmuc_01097 [Roseovarius mucosus DSM 17069]
MRDRNTLFFEDDLDGQLRARQGHVSGAVDGVPKDQFLVSSDEELIEYIAASLHVEPLVLHEEAKSMNQTETQIDVSGDKNGYFSRGGGPFHIPGTRVDITIPFTGEEWIFRYRTNPWSTAFPRADVQRGHLKLTISQPHDADPNTFKSSYDREIKLIREYVERSQKQIESYNASLPNLIRSAVTHRRDRLGRHGNIAALLDIPLAAKPGAPSIAPVKIEVRKPPRLPVPPKTGLVPEPGITDEAYEQILRFIRHQGRTFERTPSTYAVHGEEDLRNIVLAQLNGHFQGDAVGEAFRGKGKTDICIEQDNRAAFVGECKLWSGPAGLTAALDQLLGYLTWRDSKAALIMFNSKNKDFTKILEAMPETLRAHPLFMRDLPCNEAGEWRMQMRSEEDAGRRVTVHAYVFNLYQSGEPRIRSI